MINHLYQRFAPNSILVDGFVHELWKALHKSIEIKNKEARSELIDFVLERVSEGVSRTNKSISGEFVSFIPITFKNISGNAEARSFLIKRYSEFFKGIIESNLKFRFERLSSDEARKHFSYIYETIYYGYISFLHLVLEGRSESEIKEVLDDFRSINEYVSTNYSEKRFDIEFLLDQPATDQQNTNLQVKQLFLLDYNSRIHFQTAFALRSWFYYLFSLDKVSAEDLKSVVNGLNVQYTFFEELMHDLDRLMNSEYSSFLGLSEWDIVERRDSVVYSPPSPRHWATFGATVLLIKYGKPEIEYRLISKENEYAYLLETFREHLNYIRGTYEKWEPILGIGIESFEQRASEILDIFSTLKRRHFAEIEREIVEQPLDSELVQEFSSSLSKSFKSNFVFYNLFDHFGKIVPHESSEDLQSYNFLQYLLRFKMMLVKQHHTTIFNSSDLGGQFARRLNNVFLRNILTLKKDIPVIKSSIEGVDSIIGRLSEKKFFPSVIIVPTNFSVRQDWLKDNTYFKPIWAYQNEVRIKEEVGRYKEIPIIRLFDRYLGDNVIICDFSRAFNLHIYQNKDLHDNILSITLRLLSSNEIEEKFNEDLTKHLIDENGVTITPEEAKTRLAATILLRMELFGKMEILNPEAIEIISIAKEVRNK